VQGPGGGGKGGKKEKHKEKLVVPVKAGEGILVGRQKPLKKQNQWRMGKEVEGFSRNRGKWERGRNSKSLGEGKPQVLKNKRLGKKRMRNPSIDRKDGGGGGIEAGSKVHVTERNQNAFDNGNTTDDIGQTETSRKKKCAPKTPCVGRGYLARKGILV